MKRRLILLIVVAAVLIAAAPAIILAQDDIAEHRSCAYCGMDRKAYGFSRMLIRYENGSEVGVCSLHCAVVELNANPGRKVKSLLVADRGSRSLINAEGAFWVMGGKKRGVMTQLPKWAFRTREGAESFIDEYGGKLVTWEEALTAARREVAQETP